MNTGAALLAFVLAGMVLPQPAAAQPDAGDPLLGSWRLVSFQLRVVGENAPPVETFGPHPFGRLVLTPSHAMTAFIARPGRKPPASQAEAAALLSSMTAYTGRFRVEGDKFITTVDGAWNEIYTGTEQVRYFTLKDERLSIRTAEQPSAILPGKRTIATLVWERER